ncbi:DUF2634 domain-containing protein [Paenibacillus sp. MWE-103]|uniref:DUF2634 domain-containing protein n=2 Tax=Paenibacillus artemisiicola TaxID=1172618 RepID=A0ABS3WG80_9BACL|nr:DUF2634 domain-containing protein [Paenibacillus artemisiicola]
MFPNVTLLPVGPNTQSGAAPLGRVFLFDFETRRFVLQDGKPVEASHEQAIYQWVMMLLITEPDQYPIYTDTGFGMQFKHFIGRRDIPIGVINSELRRQLEEKVLLHPEITGIDNAMVTRAENEAVLSLQVQTLRGLTVTMERRMVIDGRAF